MSGPSLHEICPICTRELGTINIDRHHLIPKCRGGKEQYFLHRICHRKIHATFTEKELEKKFYTWDELKAHLEIIKFVEWVARKPSDYYDSTVTSNKKRR